MTEPTNAKKASETLPAGIDGRLLQLSLAALGVVFGDIATSRYTPSGNAFTGNTEFR